MQVGSRTPVVVASLRANRSSSRAAAARWPTSTAASSLNTSMCTGVSSASVPSPLPREDELVQVRLHFGRSPKVREGEHLTGSRRHLSQCLVVPPQMEQGALVGEAGKDDARSRAGPHRGRSPPFVPRRRQRPPGGHRGSRARRAKRPAARCTLGCPLRAARSSNSRHTTSARVRCPRHKKCAAAPHQAQRPRARADTASRPSWRTPQPAADWSSACCGA